MLSQKKYWILLLAFFIWSSACFSQSAGVDISKEKFLSINQKLDSLPYFIKAGQADLYQVCQIKQHAKYSLKQFHSTFTVSSLT
ncbi:MAG: hypothetical protein ACRDEB_08225, partial [Chitinophagaceae bacterium]